MSIIAIMQSNYLPWLGFFELMFNSDLFVLFDDVQYTKRDWRNRNRIRTKDGWTWLTVPVLVKNKQKQRISEVKINNSIDWRKKHLGSIEINYSKARYFKYYFHYLEQIYAYDFEYLVDLNEMIIRWLCKMLGLRIPIINSSICKVDGEKEERIIKICNKLGVYKLYDSKKAAELLDIKKFDEAGIKVSFQDYLHPVYRQVYTPFIPYMSTVDLLFNCGPYSLDVLLNKFIQPASATLAVNTSEGVL